jgi:hypothetical protein
MSRSKKHRGLYANCHYDYNKEFVDIDYINKLTDEEAEWYSNFLDNYYGGRFKKDDSKNPIKDRNASYNAAHERRRDFMSARFKSRIKYYENMHEGLEATERGIYKTTQLSTPPKPSLSESDE